MCQEVFANFDLIIRHQPQTNLEKLCSAKRMNWNDQEFWLDIHTNSTSFENPNSNDPVTLNNNLVD